MTGGAIVWLDILLFQALATFAFDWLLLWATAAVTKVPVSGRRLAGAALLGTGYFALYVLAEQGLTPFAPLWRSPGFIVVVSFAMLLVAFGPGPWKRMLHVAGHFYAIGFVGAGAGTAASFMLRGEGGPDSIVGFLAAGGAILLVAELGWGAVQRQLWRQVYRIPLEIRFDGRVQRLTALVDTGNRLRDPLTGEPVIVVERSVLQPLLPDYLHTAVEEMAAGDLQAVTRLLASERWSRRFRIIPFSSVGREHGLLAAFKPDEVRVALQGEPVPAGKCVLGLCKEPLDPDGVYQALIHPEVLEAAAARKRAGFSTDEADRVPEGAITAKGRHSGDVAGHSEV